MELKPGYKQTEVGVIPEDWDVVLLDSVARRGSGHTPDKAHPEYWGGDIKWVSLADSQRLDNLYISETSATITPEGIANSSANLLPAGSCIVTRDAGVGKSAILAEPMAVSQHFMAWHCGPHLSNHYLYFLLQAMKPELERIAIGNTIKTIGLPYFKSLRIQLPSLAEQNSIALALTEVDQLIRELERSAAKKQAVKQVAMQELLTGKRRLPGFEGEWEVTSVKDVVSRHFCGPSPTCEERNIEGDHEWGVLKTTAITWEKGWSWKAHKLLPPSYWGKTDIELRKGDVLVTKAGPRHRVGVSTWVDHIPRRIIPSGKMIALRPIPKKAEPLMLATAIASRETQIFLDQRTTGMAESQVNFENSILLSAPISLPSIDEQSAISGICSDFDKEIRELENKISSLRGIKQGMMQQLLTGKIRLI